MEYLKQFERWKQKATEQSVVSALNQMQGDDERIKNAFYKNLEFGTAGLRGIMDAGTNCMNYYTVSSATQGLADYMKAKKKTVACVTYDSRLNSEYFSQTVARVFATNGIKCFITKGCKPTPFLSYMTRELGCDVGVNVTASHNPKQYNGYKVYDEKGCQLTDDDANEVTSFIEKVDVFAVDVMPFDQALKQGLVQYVDETVEQNYLQAVLRQSLNKADGITVAYTPLNGTGYEDVPKVLRSLGVNKVAQTPDQCYPDGNFTTCPYPNPEKKENLDKALTVAVKEDADVVIGTDPDCDRIGVAVKSANGYEQLTGNEVGVLLCDYVLHELREKNAIPQDAEIVKTIVTTEMSAKIAQDYGVGTVNVLTGFKYIGNEIAKLEAKGKADCYLFGFEESCGYLKGTYVRDKDAVVASMLVAEMVAFHKRHGTSAWQRLGDLYAKYGTYTHKTFSFRFDGASGEQRKNAILSQLRTAPLTEIGASKVVQTVDFLTQKQFDLPSADVLKYTMANGSQLIVRPSGTEPLVKNYVTVCGTVEENEKTVELIVQSLNKIYQ